MNFGKVSLLTAVLLLFINVLSADATTITFQNSDDPGGYSGNQATFIDESDPNGNYGNSVTMTVSNCPPFELRSLIKFTDIFGPDVTNQIQAGSSIISATLRLMVDWSDEDPLNIYLITTSWEESNTTWSSFGVNVDGGEAGEDWETPEISTANFLGGYFDFNVTSAVSAWSSGTANNGLILLMPRAGDGSDFYSEDDLDFEWRPLLTVEYEENAVPEPLSIILLGLGLGISWFTKKFRNR